MRVSGRYARAPVWEKLLGGQAEPGVRDRLCEQGVHMPQARNLRVTRFGATRAPPLKPYPAVPLLGRRRSYGEAASSPLGDLTRHGSLAAADMPL
jgi:hypothetical protein